MGYGILPMFPNFILVTDPLVATTFGDIELLRPVCKWSLTSTLIARPSLIKQLRGRTRQADRCDTAELDNCINRREVVENII